MFGAELSLMAIAAVQILAFLILLGVVLATVPRLGKMSADIQETLQTLRKTLSTTEMLVSDIKDRRVVEKVLIALDSASGAVNKVEPLATDLKATMANARELLDDATQTSQSVRQRIDDLAATQSELNELVKSLTDVSCQLRDNDLARKLTNVLSDASLLAADLGMLTENANSYLESGKPLVSNISNAVSNARDRASGIKTTISSIKDGLQSGQRTGS